MGNLLKARLFMLVLVLSIPPACGGEVDKIGTVLPTQSGTNQPTRSNLGISWTTQTTPTVNTLNTVAWSGSVFVAAGDSGTILRSGDGGTTWTAATSIALAAQTVDFNDVIFDPGSGGFVAVGDAIVVLGSADGNTWTLATVPAIPVTYKAVGSNGFGTLVAMGTTCTIIRSTDNGANWTEVLPKIAPVAAADLITVVWSDGYFNSSGALVPGKFLAAGSNGLIVTSSDGSAWTIRQDSSIGADWWLSSAWNGSTYVLVGGTSGAVGVSSDGISWTTDSTAITSTTAEGVTWSNDQFLVVGYVILGAALYDSKLATTSDGTAWSTGTLGTLGTPLFDVVGVTGKYVAVGMAGTIITSP